MARRYTRIHRLLRIMNLIQSGGIWDARRLADECGTTERNVYRDLSMLEGAGVPYTFDKEIGGYRIRRDFFMPPVELTLEESLALIALAEQVGKSDQIAFMKPIARAVEKLRGRLPPAIREQVCQFDHRLQIRLARAMSGDGVADVYETVRAAIAKRRALRCAYDSVHRDGDRHRSKGFARAGDGKAGSKAWTAAIMHPSTSAAHVAPARAGSDDGETFLFRPYCLFWGQRAWNAVGQHDGRSEIRTMKLNRFTRIELTDRPFMIPDDFSLDEHLGNAWRMIRGDRTYQIELWFDAAFAETIADTHWHPTQEIEDHPDDSMTFRCEVDGLDEIVWWVLSMGPHCVVKRPKELATRVEKLAAETVGKYGVRTPSARQKRSTANDRGKRPKSSPRNRASDRRPAGSAG